MRKPERVLAAVAGAPVDSPPFSVWYHFGLQHLPGRALAEAELAFYRYFDLDFLKVMHDYPFPLPDDMTEVSRPEEWRRLTPLPGNHPALREQLAALEAIGQGLRGEALFIDTVFSPWTTARRLRGQEGLLSDMRRHPEDLCHGLTAIAETCAAYVRETAARGIAGIFLSVGGASYEFMGEEEYARFGRPFDLTVLQAARDLPFNVLHLHGVKLMFNACLDYPVQAFNWSHWHTQPTLAAARQLTGKCLLGGVDEVSTSTVRPRAIRDQVAQAVREAGGRGLILGPGCAVPSDTPPFNLHAIREAARAVRV